MIASILLDTSRVTLREGVFGQHCGLREHASRVALKRKIKRTLWSLPSIASGLE